MERAGRGPDAEGRFLRKRSKRSYPAMEGKTRPRQRTPQVLRTFNPTRLQDNLLAAVYDRLLEARVRVQDPLDKLEQPQLEAVSAKDGQLAKTGG